jgi:hypothetical protein
MITTNATMMAKHPKSVRRATIRRSISLVSERQTAERIRHRVGRAACPVERAHGGHRRVALEACERMA